MVDVVAQQCWGSNTASACSFVETAEICRPPDNFFDAVLIGSLADAFEWLDEQGTRGIILCSEGRHFCAGAGFTGRSSPFNICNGPGELYQRTVRLFPAPIPVCAA